MSGRPIARPIGCRQASHLDRPVTVLSADRPISRCMTRQAGLSAGRQAGRPIGRPIGRHSGRQGGRLAGQLPGIVADKVAG